MLALAGLTAVTVASAALAGYHRGRRTGRTDASAWGVDGPPDLPYAKDPSRDGTSTLDRRE